MNAVFDDSLLDDAEALLRADHELRVLAEAGPRVRREATQTAEACDRAVSMMAGPRPRAVVAAGPDSRLLRAVLEPWCPVPFVAWPAPGLPGWAGGLDLVVVLAPVGSDRDAASAVAEAVRRGCPVVVAAPQDSLVAEHATGRDCVLLPTVTGDQLAIAVAVLDVVGRLGLGPRTDAEVVAAALDAVAVRCSPHRDIATNPAKIIALALADTTPLVWGGTALAARAARRVAEGIRAATGQPALAGDADHLLPVLEGAPRRDVFADPFAEDELAGEGDSPRPGLLVLDDGATDPLVRTQRGMLRAAADSAGVRVETVDADAGSELARYASLLATGHWAASYLALGMGRTGSSG